MEWSLPTTDKLKSLYRDGAFAEATVIGRMMIADGNRDTTALRILVKLFSAVGDAAGEHAALDALGENAALSSAELHRLVQLHLAAGDAAAAEMAAYRSITDGSVDAETVFVWYAKDAGADALIGLRESLAGSEHDSIANRLALVKHHMAAGGDRDAARKHALAAAAMPIGTDGQASVVGKRLIDFGLQQEAIAFARRWRDERPEAQDESRGIELHALYADGNNQDEAVVLATEIAERTPRSATAAYWAARALRKWNSNPRLALAALRRAMDLGADNAGLAELRARMELAAGNPQDALPWCRAAFAEKPTNHSAGLLVHCLLDTGGVAEAVSVARSWAEDGSRTDGADNVDRLGLLAHALRYARQYDEALSLLRGLAAMESADGRATSFLMADMLDLLGRSEEVAAILDAQPRTAPSRPSPEEDAGLYHLFLSAGRLDEAYSRLAWRPERIELNAIWPQGDWRGRDLSGRHVLFLYRGGIGDEVRWLTALGDLVADAGKVSATCDPRLLPILSRSFAGVTFLPFSRNAPRRHPDRSLPFSRLADDTVLDVVRRTDATVIGAELFALYRPSLDSFRRDGAFLLADPGRRARWRGKLGSLGDRPKVAFCWRSGTLNHRRGEAYTRITDWSPVFALRDDVAFLNLQHDAQAAELDTARAALGNSLIELRDIDLRNDLEDIFAILAEVDLVIGPNTALLNFAGAVAAQSLFLNPRPSGYLKFRLADPTTGADRLYASHTHIRGDAPLDALSLMGNAAAAIAARFGLAPPAR